MIRRVIQIDEEKCNGCGACAKACHEGAIGMVNGKAKLMRDDYWMALEIVFQPAQRTPYPLLSEKLPPMTKRQWKKTKNALASLFSMAARAQ